MARGAMTHRLAAGQRATVALRRVIEPCACGARVFRPTVSKKKDTHLGVLLFWRRGRDSNPRVVSHKLISSPFGYLEVIEQYYPNLALF